MQRSLPFVVAVISALALSASCSRTTASPSETDAASSSATQPSVQTLNIAHDATTVGAEVRATASGLPAGKTVELTWKTVSGGWVIEDYYHFHGKKYAGVHAVARTFPGRRERPPRRALHIPEDYGGVHDVIALIDGKPVAQNGIEVTQSFEMTPASGPVGTPIELRVKGLGWRTMESTWVVNWDNNLLGFVSAAGSKGSAVARFRAAGPAGHAHRQAADRLSGAGLPEPRAVADSAPAASAVHVPHDAGSRRGARGVRRAAISRQPMPETGGAGREREAGAQRRRRGRSARSDRCAVKGFPADARCSSCGRPTSAAASAATASCLRSDRSAQLTVGRDGRIDAPVTIPDDLGGLHGLALRDGDETLARTFFVIETSIVSISPQSGPVGTPVTIHLKGVGWTEYDNIYVATYDNAYMGYACGFNSQGDVVINFTATGAPGVHIIDLYPGIYQGPPTEPQLLYRQPQLTYADDHPGNKIPALRFTFEVTQSGGEGAGGKGAGGQKAVVSSQ